MESQLTGYRDLTERSCFRKSPIGWNSSHIVLLMFYRQMRWVSLYKARLCSIWWATTAYDSKKMMLIARNCNKWKDMKARQVTLDYSQRRLTHLSLSRPNIQQMCGTDAELNCAWNTGVLSRKIEVSKNILSILYSYRLLSASFLRYIYHFVDSLLAW